MIDIATADKITLPAYSYSDVVRNDSDGTFVVTIDGKEWLTEGYLYVDEDNLSVGSYQFESGQFVSDDGSYSQPKPIELKFFHDYENTVDECHEAARIYQHQLLEETGVVFPIITR